MSDTGGHTPVSEQVFLILLALTEGPAHGYGILLGIAERTQQRVQLGTGTLYSAIKRLRSEGLVEESPAPPDSDDPRRRYYRLTDAGRSLVRAEAERHADLAELARERGVIPA